ncbi:MAG: hypothetical protein R2688_10960, partial [Fimbriimonadaceae bacterium]
RTGIQTLKNTIRDADLIVSTHTAGVTANTDSENLLIREPVFDGLGRKVSGQHKIVWIYYQSTSDKKKKPGVIYRRESLVNGSTIGNFSSAEEVVSNIEKVKWSYRFSTQLAVQTTGTSLPLNYNLSLSKANSTRAQITKIACSRAGIDVDLKKGKGALSAILGTVLQLPSGVIAGDIIDIEADSDPAYAPLSGGGSLANIVDFKIKYTKEGVDESEGEVERNESYSVKLQNFRG